MDVVFNESILYKYRIGNHKEVTKDSDFVEFEDTSYNDVLKTQDTDTYPTP